MADIMTRAATWLAVAGQPTLTISKAFTGEPLGQY